MPLLHRLPHCKIEMRSRDHRPAHVHVLFSDGREALVYLADLKVEASSLSGFGRERRKSAPARPVFAGFAAP